MNKRQLSNDNINLSVQNKKLKTKLKMLESINNKELIEPFYGIIGDVNIYMTKTVVKFSKDKALPIELWKSIKVKDLINWVIYMEL